jgi:hypothetical protein
MFTSCRNSQSSYQCFCSGISEKSIEGKIGQGSKEFTGLPNTLLLQTRMENYKKKLERER